MAMPRQAVVSPAVMAVPAGPAVAMPGVVVAVAGVVAADGVVSVVMHAVLW
jgi:hypothetical protein